MRQKRLTTLVLVCIGLVLFGFVALYYKSPDWVAKSALGLERLKSGLKKRSLTVDNMRFAYLTGGKGPVLLMLHGFGGSKDNFTRLAGYLSDDYKVIIPDLPGFGESTRNPAWDYAIPSQALRLHAFIDAMGLKSFHLSGNSMGGGIAVAYAVNHPERVESLFLLDPGPIKNAPPSELFQMVEKGKNPFFIDNLQDYDELMEMAFADMPFIPRPIRVYFARQMIADRKFLEKAMNDLIPDPYPLETNITLYPGPVMAVWGDQDRIMHPDCATILADKSPRIDKAIIEDCGHLPMLEKPKETARLYLNFLTDMPAN